MNILEILLGQLPEALYFALFIIFTKQIKTKRCLFTSLTVTEYILLLNAFRFSIWSHILYFALFFTILKLLYKEKSQITDIFTLGVASLLLMIISAICYWILNAFTVHIVVGNIIQKLVVFTILILLRHKLPNIQNWYKHLWNRNDKIPKFMKSTTFRCINLVIFNIMFYFINIVMIFSLTWR